MVLVRASPAPRRKPSLVADALLRRFAGEHRADGSDAKIQTALHRPERAPTIRRGTTTIRPLAGAGGQTTSAFTTNATSYTNLSMVGARRSRVMDRTSTRTPTILISTTPARAPLAWFARAGASRSNQLRRLQTPWLALVARAVGEKFPPATPSPANRSRCRSTARPGRLSGMTISPAGNSTPQTRRAPSSNDLALAARADSALTQFARGHGGLSARFSKWPTASRSTPSASRTN